MKKIAISIGDLNGISLHQILIAHEKVSKLVEPTYYIDKEVLNKVANMLNIEIPKKIKIEPLNFNAEIEPAIPTASSGLYSFKSLESATDSVISGANDALCTMPINKYSWSLAGLKYKGHTHYLGEKFNKNPLMVLGCEKLMIALLTDHIPIKDVTKNITKKALDRAMKIVAENFDGNISVLGLNPHASDDGVLGNEEIIIKNAIDDINSSLSKKRFFGPMVPDVAFIKSMLDKYNIYLCMYHDQGLIPLKTLYFDESINITLNIGIKRASPDHGTAYDIAYKKKPNIKSYINAIKYLSK